MAGNLFYLPRQVPIDSGVVVPGAKATFTQTGTTTPQNTYTDVDLTTPHANPVVADSNGVFAPIYFDPSFGDYRVKLTDSADVLIYQDDDIPASQSGQSLTLTAAAPFIDLIENDASANNGVWRIAVNGEQLTLKLGNDALSAFTDILTIDRTANTVDAIAINGSSLTNAGTLANIGTATFSAGVTSDGAFDNLGRGWNITRFKSADQSRNGGTADLMANDADLTYAIPAAGTYAFEVFAMLWADVDGTQGAAFNMNFSGTVGSGSRFISAGYINGSTIGHVTYVVANAVSTQNFIAADVSTTAYADGIHFTGTLVASTTGTLAFAWAQDVLDATNALNFGAGSYLKVSRVS